MSIAICARRRLSGLTPSVGLFALLVALRSHPAGAADVITYVVGKNHHFDQFAGVPTENTTGEAWEAGVNVYTTYTGTVASATIALPAAGVSLPLANRGARFELSEYFDNKAQLDSTIPTGNYVVTMATLNDGVKACGLALTADAYPNAPLLLSTNEAARIDPRAPFTLRWAPFAGGTTNDFILVVAAPLHNEGPTNYFVSPLPNQPLVLRGTNTQVIVPANSLPTDSAGYFKVGFFHAVDRNLTAYPGVPGYSGYGSITKLPFQTLGPPAVINPLPATLTTNAGANVELRIEASGGLLNYQWRKDGVNLSGATNASLLLPNVRATNAGAYTVVVSNPLGALTNGPAYLVITSGSPGSLDPDFAVGTGASAAVRALAVRPDGRLLVGGSFTTFNAVARPRLVSLTRTGSVDSTFAPPNGADNDVHALALQPNQKVVVGGSFNFIGGVQRPGLARLETNGTVDATFSAGSGLSGVFAVALRNDGRIAAGGSFLSVGGTPRARLALLNTNGALETGFNASCNGDVRALAFLPDQRLLVAGGFTTVNGTPRPVIARLLPDGTLDPTFHAPSNITFNAYAVAVQPDGRIVLGGGFDKVDDLNVGRILRLLPDGSLDSTFRAGVGAGFNIRSLFLQPDNKIVIGGEFNAYDNLPQNRVARLNPDGTLDRTLNVGTGANNIVMSLVPQPDGGIAAGGFFTAFNGTPAPYVARMLGDPRSPAPVFTYQPVNRVVFQNDPVGFEASAASSLPVTYQWRRDGVDLPDATNAGWRIPAAQFVDQADYSVRVTTAAGSLTSSNAHLTVRAQPGLLEHLAHRYSFGEPAGTTTALDSVGNAHGTLVALGAGDGFAGTGQLNLAGNSGYVDLPDHLLSPLTNLTLEAWVTWNGPSNSQYQTIFYFAGGSSAFHLTPYSDFPNARVFFSTNFTVLARPVLRNAPPPLGSSVHYAVVYDFAGGLAKFYVNGRLVAIGAAPSPLSGLNDINNWLGHAPGAPGFNGVYDEFRIYDDALSDDAVWKSFQGGPDVEQLSLQVSAGSIVLSWPILATPHVLEATPDLTTAFLTFPYTAVTNVATASVSVTLPPTTPQQFFRLRRL